MNAVFYSIAFSGSEIAPVQLVRSLHSLRAFDTEMQVILFYFGDPPPGFMEAIQRFEVEIRNLGNYVEFVRGKQARHGELFALDPKLHRWLVLQEPELTQCERILYIDSDTFFLRPPSLIFDAYRDADLYAREEPFSQRSILGYNDHYVHEDGLADLRDRESLEFVPPFNTGVCMLSRRMREAITSILPVYFDNIFRFFSWFHQNPLPGANSANSSIRAVYDARFHPDTGRALPYPSQNRWIVDQVAMWLALGTLSGLKYGDFQPSDVWQGPEFRLYPRETPRPILCHYFGSNFGAFFDWLQASPKRMRG